MVNKDRSNNLSSLTFIIHHFFEACFGREVRFLLPPFTLLAAAFEGAAVLALPVRWADVLLAGVVLSSG